MMSSIVGHPTPLHYSHQAAVQTEMREERRRNIKQPADSDAAGRDYEARVPKPVKRPKLDLPRFHGFTGFSSLIAEA